MRNHLPETVIFIGLEPNSKAAAFDPGNKLDFWGKVLKTSKILNTKFINR